MPDENYYDDGGGEEAPQGETVPATEDSARTALIPSQLCPGMQPGDRIELTITRVLDGQYEVSYDKEGESPEEPAPASGDADMDEMMA